MQFFYMSISDNGLFAFHDQPGLSRCPVCGELLAKWEEPLPGFSVSHLKGLDISTTYDGMKSYPHGFGSSTTRNK